jgi:glutamate-5-semialdehyde dehydrogenase
MSPDDPKYDRLLLNEKRIEDLALAVEHVAALPTYLGVVLEQSTRPNGLHLRKISVPIGAVGMIYEARPNVTIEAADSNTALVQSVKTVLKRHNLEDAVLLMPNEREHLATLLQATDYIDVIIPRGSNNLIQYVRDNARVPVIETGAGVVHIYYDAAADLAKGKPIIENSKTRRVSVCNALDALIIHRDRLKDLPELCAGLIKSKNVQIHADASAFAALSGAYPENLLTPAAEEDFGREFLDYKMAVKTVDSLEAALAHVARHSSRHSEVIVTEDPVAAARFTRQTDAAVVYVNASTAFTDGGEFGMGAEIGISTQKLHARGPFALRELTSYKWIVEGSGQVR